MSSNSIKKRKDVALENTWKLEDLYNTEADWEADYKKIEHKIKELSVYQGKICDSADSLKSCLDLLYEIEEKLEKIYVYANQRYHQDTADSKYQDLAMQSQNLMIKVNSASAFIQPEILQSDKMWIDKQIELNGGLSLYKRELDNLFRRKSHVLSKELENLLAKTTELGNAPGNIFSMFNNADIKFPTIKDEYGNTREITQSRYVLFLENKSRKVREDAFRALYKTYAQFKNTLAATFEANVKQALFFAEARKYNSTRAAELDKGNIPEAVYDNLIATIHKNMHIMHKYVRLRKKLLEVDELHMYDAYTPLVPDIDMKFSFKAAKKCVKEGLKPLGEEYQNLLQKGFDNRWIDIYENDGKRSGAYSWGAYDTHPYVLLNYNESLDNVFTLAHEMGHAMHSYYSNKNQSFVYAGYSIFVAEVASTCNEALLNYYMIENASTKQEKAYLINHFLESFKATVYRQAMFAEFEYMVHQKAAKAETLTADKLCTIYRDLNRTYFGEDMIVDEEIGLEWARIPHFYTPFYVYQYATGFCAAIALSNRILLEGQKAVEDYKKFLSSGSARDPIDVLKLAGVDMTTSEPIIQALQVFEKYLNLFEETMK